MCGLFEKLGDAATEAGQQGFAGQIIVFGQRHHIGKNRRVINHYGVLFHRNEPDFVDACGEVFAQLAVNLFKGIIG